MSEQLIEILRALADENRLEIIRQFKGKDELACQEVREESVLSQPTVSHHLSKLVDAGILEVRKEGTCRFYRLNRDVLAEHGIDIKKF